MNARSDIRKWLSTKFPVLHDSIQVIDHSDQFQVQDVRDAVIIVHAAWSGPSIANTLGTIERLLAEKYEYKILIIDIDCMSTSFQLENLGHLCQGKGELFLVQDGTIIRI